MPHTSPSAMIDAGYVPKKLVLKLIDKMFIGDTKTKIGLYKQYAITYPDLAMKNAEFINMIAENKDKIVAP